jgi:predicted transcriptional regulator
VRIRSSYKLGLVIRLMQLGELEKQVLQYLWETEVADAKQVYAYFEKRRGGSLNTIQSTLDRLFKKGLLKRDKQGHAFQYQAAIERDTFIGQLIKGLTSEFNADKGNSLLAAFTSVSPEFNEDQLERLEQIIEDQRDKNKSDGSV